MPSLILADHGHGLDQPGDEVLGSFPFKSVISVDDMLEHTEFTNCTRNQANQEAPYREAAVEASLLVRVRGSDGLEDLRQVAVTRLRQSYTWTSGRSAHYAVMAYPFHCEPNPTMIQIQVRFLLPGVSTSCRQLLACFLDVASS